jgi:tetratricopeptide (TPR) repeat protein
MISRRCSIVCFLMFILLSVPLFSQDRPDALRLYRTGNYEQAIEVCKAELEVNPNNMDSYSVLCWSLLSLGRHAEALEWARKGMQVVRFDSRMVQVAGEANYHLGNNLDALKWFEEYASIAPTGMRIDLVYYHMGEIFIRLGEFNNADIALTTAVYHSDSIARWWARLGYAREMAEDYSYALAAYNRALQLNSGLSEAIRGKERVETKQRS